MDGGDGASRAPYERLASSGHRSVPWRNGRGVTAEIVAEPPTGTWDWRLSIADVTASDEFSIFAGVERVIVVVEGAGMALTVGPAAERLLAPLEPFAFVGEARTVCRLPDGPVRDLNLMTSRSRCRGRLEIVTLEDGEELAAAGWAALVVVAGTVSCDDAELQVHDAVRARAAGARPAIRSRGPAAVAIIWIDPC